MAGLRKLKYYSIALLLSGIMVFLLTYNHLYGQQHIGVSLDQNALMQKRDSPLLPDNSGEKDSTKENVQHQKIDHENAAASAKKVDLEQETKAENYKKEQSSETVVRNYTSRENTLSHDNNKPNQEKDVAARNAKKYSVDTATLFRRSLSFGAFSGNLYTTNYAGVVHIVVFSEESTFTALLTLANSIVKNSRMENLTFHFITPSNDRLTLHNKLSNSVLRTLAYEVVGFPDDWRYSNNPMDFAPIRLQELLPYMGGRVVMLAPHCLVLGDVGQLADTAMLPSHWAAMATLCSPDPAANVPDIHYGHYLNFSHEAIAKLHLLADTCAPATAVMVFNITRARRGRARTSLWEWVHLNERTPVFLKPEGQEVSSKGAYAIVYHNHTSLLEPQWYTRVNEKSQLANTDSLLYHWVGSPEPWLTESKIADLWKKYVVKVSDG